jgi:DNA polymerase-3 subunit delta
LPGKSKISVEELRRNLRKKVLAPVYVLEGEESLLASEATTAILDAALPPAGRDFNLGTFSGDDDNGRQFLAQARSFPFLAERRVVLVRRFDKLLLKDREEDEFLAYLKDPAATTVLVLVAAKLDRRTTLAKAVERHAQLVACEFPEAELPGWVKARFAARQVAVTEGAIHLLVELAGPGLLDLSNEVDKVLARYPEAKRIEESHVEATVDRHRLESVFATKRVFRPDNVTEFMQTVDRILESGSEGEVFGLLGFMAWQVNLLLRIRLMLDRGTSRAGDIAARLKKNPWQVEQTIPQARQFTQAQLRLWQRNLQRAELQMKSQSLPERWLFERALLHSFLGRELA